MGFSGDFLVDITQHLSDLNLKLQNKNQFPGKIFEHNQSFNGNLELLQSQLKEIDIVHLGTLKIMIASSQFSQLHVYIDAIKKLSEEFGVQFKDFRGNEKAFELFANPFTVEIDNSPTELQLNLISMN